MAALLYTSNIPLRSKPQAKTNIDEKFVALVPMLGQREEGKFIFVPPVSAGFCQ